MGTSPEVLPNGQTSYSYRTGTKDPTMFLSSLPSASTPPQTTDPADPSGWLYTLVFDETFAMNAQVQSEFPDVAPFRDCTTGNKSYGAQPFETVLFTTITHVCRMEMSRSERRLIEGSHLSWLELNQLEDPQTRAPPTLLQSLLLRLAGPPTAQPSITAKPAPASDTSAAVLISQPQSGNVPAPPSQTVGPAPAPPPQSESAALSAPPQQSVNSGQGITLPVIQTVAGPGKESPSSGNAVGILSLAGSQPSSQTTQVSEEAGATNVPLPVSADAGILNPAPPPVLVMGSQTLSAGGPPVNLDSTVVSLPPGASSIFVNGNPQPMPNIAPNSPSLGTTNSPAAPIAHLTLAGSSVAPVVGSAGSIIPGPDEGTVQNGNSGGIPGQQASAAVSSGALASFIMAGLGNGGATSMAAQVESSGTAPALVLAGSTLTHGTNVLTPGPNNVPVTVVQTSDSAGSRVAVVAGQTMSAGDTVMANNAGGSGNAFEAVSDSAGSMALAFAGQTLTPGTNVLSAGPNNARVTAVQTQNTAGSPIAVVAGQTYGADATLASSNLVSSGVVLSAASDIAGQAALALAGSTLTSGLNVISAAPNEAPVTVMQTANAAGSPVAIFSGKTYGAGATLGDVALQRIVVIDGQTIAAAVNGANGGVATIDGAQVQLASNGDVIVAATDSQGRITTQTDSVSSLPGTQGPGAVFTLNGKAFTALMSSGTGSQIVSQESPQTTSIVVANNTTPSAGSASTNPLSVTIDTTAAGRITKAGGNPTSSGASSVAAGAASRTTPLHVWYASAAIFIWVVMRTTFP